MESLIRFTLINMLYAIESGTSKTEAEDAHLQQSTASQAINKPHTKSLDVKEVY